ncbi:MAG: response regulator [Candidatus Omnitrophica bacterium]|nr:response regulator [Candidatus Omnitrophota bacterium]
MAKKKILIVDDEPDILRAAKVRLMSFGYDVLTATDGNNIPELIAKEIPDLILLDLRLPGMSGDEICVRLKTDEKFKKIPVILFTASSDFNINNMIKKIGADGYLIKPFSSEDLLQVTKKFLG